MYKQEVLERWKGRIAEWEQSGLSQAQYCRNNNLDSKLFSKWKNRVNKQDSHLDTGFVEITGNKRSTWAEKNILLHIHNKYTLEISPGFNKEVLHELLTMLEY